MKKIVLSVATLATVLTASGTEEVSSSDNSFMDRLELKADLRLRYESIERDDYDITPGDENKYRERYRLRLFANYDLTDNLTLETGMRSGFGNPTSGNQTFEDMPISDYFLESLRVNILDIAYKSGNSTLKVGRHPYMIYRPIKSQLVWDNDISLNGVSYNYEDDAKIINLGVNQPTYAEDVPNDVDDVNLAFAQYVHKTKLENSKLNLGAAFYYYDGLKGNKELYGSGKGNTTPGDIYSNDYHIAEAFGELQFEDVLGMPFTAAASVAYNTAASDNNFGYDLAFQLGKAKDIGDWQVKYSYTDIEADAVLGAHSDSDNFGGGTNAKGHAIRAKYKIAKNMYLAGNFFFNTINKDTTKDDYDRMQLDFIVKF
jgi:hypothetical protein